MTMSWMTIKNLPDEENQVVELLTLIEIKSKYEIIHLFQTIHLEFLFQRRLLINPRNHQQGNLRKKSIATNCQLHLIFTQTRKYHVKPLIINCLDKIYQLNIFTRKMI